MGKRFYLIALVLINYLGFGGIEYKNYRLWLDEELEAGSYASPDDTTYDKGYLVDPSISKFNVSVRGLYNMLILCKD